MKYKLIIDNPKPQIERYWGLENDDIIQDYLNMIYDISSTHFDCIEYALIQCHSLHNSTGIKYDSYKICEITDSSDLSYLSYDEADSKVEKVKVWLDESLMEGKTKFKDYRIIGLEFLISIQGRLSVNPFTSFRFR